MIYSHRESSHFSLIFYCRVKIVFFFDHSSTLDVLRTYFHYRLLRRWFVAAASSLRLNRYLVTCHNCYVIKTSAPAWFGLKFFNFFNIQGSEFEVLRSFAWHRILIDVICVGTDAKNRPPDYEAKVTRFLSDRGFLADSIQQGPNTCTLLVTFLLLWTQWILWHTFRLEVTTHERFAPTNPC